MFVARALLLHNRFSEAKLFFKSSIEYIEIVGSTSHLKMLQMIEEEYYSMDATIYDEPLVFSHIYTDNREFDEVNKIAETLISQNEIKEQISIRLFDFMKNPNVSEDNFISLIRGLREGRKTGTQYLIYNQEIDIETDYHHYLSCAAHIDQELKHTLLMYIKNIPIKIASTKGWI